MEMYATVRDDVETLRGILLINQPQSEDIRYAINGRHGVGRYKEYELEDNQLQSVKVYRNKDSHE